MYILIAILIFGVLIFVHELGHFLTAKALDVQVNEFAVCMGPALVKKTKGETTYSLRCIPIGGYCAMEGEDESSDNPRAFTSKPWWRRLIILAAGSFMNFLAGVLVLVILFSTAAGYFAVPRIDSFYEGCPYESADGLQAGDEIYKIDGRRVYIQSDVSMLLARNKTGVFDLTVRRDGRLVELKDFAMTPVEYTVDGETHALPAPFICIATQNPLGSAGTQALPESQLDRFMVSLSIGYPSLEDQMKIISAQRYINPLDELHAVTTAKNVIEVQNFLSSVTARDEMLRCAIELCEKTRSHPLVELGISPRGVSALVRMARASAVLHERNYVIPEDIQSVFLDVCAHRLVLRPQARVDGVGAKDVLEGILGEIRPPVLAKR